MMNANTIKAAIAALTQAVEALTVIIGELTTATETTEATTTETATTTTTPIIVLDDDDNVITTTETTTEATTTETATTTPEEKAMNDPKSIVVLDDDDNVIAVGKTTTETTGDLPCPPDAAETAAEDADDPATPSDEILDKIIADISALFYIAEYSLYNEAEKIGHDNSPYSPKDNTVGDIGDYKIFISKEVIRSDKHVEGSFRMIIKDKVIVNPICDYDVRIIDNHIKVFSSENTVRVEKMKENHKLLKFLEVVDDTCYLVKDKYISE